MRIDPMNGDARSAMSACDGWTEAFRTDFEPSAFAEL
jgi:hypothetical protein